MRSDTGQCLGVRQIQLHCTELVLYANTKLTCEELPGPDGGMRTTVEAGRNVGGAESVRWGVVQWRLPEVLCELRKEQG